MPRPVQAIIHTEALAHNLRRARAAAPDAKVWAVVKANAYGHGIERAYAGLRGADGFALLDLLEAERIRALGWRGPVLLLEGCFEARHARILPADPRGAGASAAWRTRGACYNAAARRHARHTPGRQRDRQSLSE